MDPDSPPGTRTPEATGGIHPPSAGLLPPLLTVSESPMPIPVSLPVLPTHFDTTCAHNRTSSEAQFLLEKTPSMPPSATRLRRSSFPNMRSTRVDDPFVVVASKSEFSKDFEAPVLSQAAAEDGELPTSLWSLYFKEAAARDDALIKHMQDDTNNIVVFSGLFSAVLAAFIVESYKLLRLDPGMTTVALLAQIAQRSPDQSLASTAFDAIVTDPDSFHASLSSLRVNVLWFVSLVLSLSYALGATLMQHWARRYRRTTERIRNQGVTPKQGRMHAYVLTGSESFGMESTVEGLPVLLHGSFVLFFAGLAEFMFPINDVLAKILLIIVGCGGVIYLGFSAIPIISPSSPYSTPLTTICHEIYELLQSLFFATSRALGGTSSRMRQTQISQEDTNIISFAQRAHVAFREWLNFALLSNRLDRIERAIKGDDELDAKAMGWTLAALMHRNDDLTVFMNAFARVRPKPTPRATKTANAVLTTPGFARRLARILEMPQIDGVLRHTKEQTPMVLSCLRALRTVITLEPDMTLCWRTFLTIMKPLKELEKDPFPNIAFNAMCTSTVVASYLMEHMTADADFSSRSEKMDFIRALLSFVDRPSDRLVTRTQDTLATLVAQLQSDGPMNNIANFVDGLMKCNEEWRTPANVNVACNILGKLRLLDPPDVKKPEKWVAQTFPILIDVRKRLLEKDWGPWEQPSLDYDDDLNPKLTPQARAELDKYPAHIRLCEELRGVAQRLRQLYPMYNAAAAVPSTPPSDAPPTRPPPTRPRLASGRVMDFIRQRPATPAPARRESADAHRPVGNGGQPPPPAWLPRLPYIRRGSSQTSTSTATATVAEIRHTSATPTSPTGASQPSINWQPAMPALNVTPPPEKDEYGAPPSPATPSTNPPSTPATLVGRPLLGYPFLTPDAYRPPALQRNHSEPMPQRVPEPYQPASPEHPRSPSLAYGNIDGHELPLWQKH